MKPSRVSSLIILIIAISFVGCGGGNKKSRGRVNRVIPGSEKQKTGNDANNGKDSDKDAQAGDSKTSPPNQNLGQNLSEEEKTKRQEELAKNTEALEAVTQEFEQLAANAGSNAKREDLHVGKYKLVEFVSYIKYIEGETDVRAVSQSTVELTENGTNLTINPINSNQKGLIQNTADLTRALVLAAQFEITSADSGNKIFPTSAESSVVKIKNSVVSDASGIKLVDSLESPDTLVTKLQLMDVLAGSASVNSSTGATVYTINAKQSDALAGEGNAQILVNGDRVSVLIELSESTADTNNNVTLQRRMLVTYSFEKSEKTTEAEQSNAAPEYQ